MLADHVSENTLYKANSFQPTYSVVGFLVLVKSEP